MLVELSQSDFYNLNLDKDRVRNLFNVNIHATCKNKYKTTEERKIVIVIVIFPQTTNAIERSITASNLIQLPLIRLKQMTRSRR